MLKSEYLEKKQRWFQAKYPETWEAEWTAWVESDPKIPGDDPPEVKEPEIKPEPVEKSKTEPKKGTAKPR